MISRRSFNLGLGTSLVSGALGARALPLAAKPRYRGPNVIIVRFGGGVRRRETIDPQFTYAPFMRHTLTRRGVLLPDMVISQLDGVDTSHAEGTLNILTGRYLSYRDAGSGFLDDRLQPTSPTLFEYLRRSYNIPVHQSLLVNGENRPQEEFFTYGAHRQFGIEYRAEMLSLHRFKLYKYANILRENRLGEQDLAKVQKQYQELLHADKRKIAAQQSAQLEKFWAAWRTHYGDSGLKNPRGDRALTELALRAIAQLRPRLMMINYQDPDYVHWGNASQYTRAIAIIDEGIKRLVKATDTDPHYRGRTVFVITPDCGRDDNALIDVPFQHHFNSRSAHQTWALICGPQIVRNRIVDRRVDQSSIAATIGAIMGFKARNAEGPALARIFT